MDVKKLKVAMINHDKDNYDMAAVLGLTYQGWNYKVKNESFSTKDVHKVAEVLELDPTETNDIFFKK